LKEVEKNPELLKKLGYTKEDYQRFLKGFEEVAKQEEQKKKTQEAQQPENPFPGAPKLNVGEATRKVERRPDGTTGSSQSSGSAYAPPGYSEAQKKFAEAASKYKREEKK
jgi:hypothetical protein